MRRTEVVMLLAHEVQHTLPRGNEALACMMVGMVSTHGQRGVLVHESMSQVGA